MPNKTETPSENSYTLVATVKEVAQATEGYGENERVVGVRVRSRYVIDVEGEAISRDLTFTLPLQLRRFSLPGDKITMTVEATDVLAPAKVVD